MSCDSAQANGDEGVPAPPVACAPPVEVLRKGVAFRKGAALRCSLGQYRLFIALVV